MSSAWQQVLWGGRSQRRGIRWDRKSLPAATDAFSLGMNEASPAKPSPANLPVLPPPVPTSVFRPGRRHGVAGLCTMKLAPAASPHAGQRLLTGVANSASPKATAAAAAVVVQRLLLAVFFLPT